MARLVALTGATGFIGGHLVRHLLDQGWRVRALVRRRTPPPDPGLETVAGALEDPDSLKRLVEGAEAVVHVAGLIKARSRAGFFRANEAGVRHLAEAIGGPATPPQVVLLSSLAAREPKISPYAASKAAGEAVLTGSGLPYTILRPPVVYGPGDRATLPFFRAAAKGWGLLLAPDGAHLSFLHVADLCGAVTSILDHREATLGHSYEPDDGHPGGYAWRDLIETAGAAAGQTPRVVRVPAALVSGAALLASGLGLLSGRAVMLSPGKAREIRHLDWVSAGASLGTATGWRPTWPLDGGFEQTIAWYREQNWL